MRLAVLVMMGVAILLSACASEPTLSPTDAPPAREATPSVEATMPSPTVAPVPTATATPTATPTPTPAPADTPVPTNTPEPTLTPTQTPTAAATPAPTLEPTATPTPTPQPTATPMPTPQPTPTPPPTTVPTATSTPSPTATPSPTPALTVNPALAGYSELLAEAASNLPPEYDFVSDGLSSDERDILDWADTRLFSNPSFLASKWGPDNWPVAVPGQGYPESRFTPKDPLSGEELQVASVQATVLMMMEIGIDRRSNGHHVISWKVDSLDRVLDGVNVYPELCVHCYGKTGYDTREGVRENYGPLIWEVGHGHREMLKAFAYYAKADGEGILVRSFMDNSADDMELLHKRGRWNSPIAVGSFNYENISFMSQIRLPGGKLVSYPTMAFSMVDNMDSERQVVERIYDYMRFRMQHFTGDANVHVAMHRPFTSTPYSPQLGWIVYVGQAGSPTSAGVMTGTFRALGLKAEQFKTIRGRVNAGSVEADGETYYYNGNDFLGWPTVPLCRHFRTLEQVENFRGQPECTPDDPPSWFGNAITDNEVSSSDREILVAFYKDTGGPDWNHNDNWLSQLPVSKWYGVSTFNGRVTHLRLDAGLTGAIPAYLSRLEHLVELDLAGNDLTGNIPPELAELPNLRLLELNRNQLTGRIPASLGNSPSLAFLGLSNNQLTGEIPSELGNLEYLAYLDLGGNNLTGGIPPELGDLRFMSSMSLRQNTLTGKIPPQLGNLRDLKSLYLWENRLTGQIPQELASLPVLQEIFLERNQLEGCLPKGLEGKHKTTLVGGVSLGLPVCSQ